MRRTSTLISCALPALAMLWVVGMAQAADHTDSPRASADPLADITDVFAWMSPDATRVNLLMGIGRDVAADAQFSDAVQYVFRTRSLPRFSFAGQAASETLVVCTFDADQQVACNIGGTVIQGDASDPAGLVSDDGRIRVFAGTRNDPFYFNGSGFRETARLVTAAAPSLDFDESGCPALDDATAQALQQQLRTEPDGSPAIDNFAGFNILALTLSIDKTLLTAGGPVVAVSGSTHARPEAAQ